MVERLRVPILVGEFSSPESTLCVDSWSVSIPAPKILASEEKPTTNGLMIVVLASRHGVWYSFPARWNTAYVLWLQLRQTEETVELTWQMQPFPCSVMISLSMDVLLYNMYVYHVWMYYCMHDLLTDCGTDKQTWRRMWSCHGWCPCCVTAWKLCVWFAVCGIRVECTAACWMDHCPYSMMTTWKLCAWFSDCLWHPADRGEHEAAGLMDHCPCSIMMTWNLCVWIIDCLWHQADRRECGAVTAGHVIWVHESCVYDLLIVCDIRQTV